MPKASVYFDLESTADQRDSEEIKRRIDRIPGVISVSVSRGRSRVAVDFDTTGTGPEKLRGALKECGCRVSGERIESHTM